MKYRYLLCLLLLIASMALIPQEAQASIEIGRQPNMALSFTGNGTAENPFLIYDVYDLQDIEDDLDAYYELANDIDASTTVGWNGGNGFNPIGFGGALEFTGNFDGNGHTIDGLYINRGDCDYLGLFGEVQDGASISNLNLTNVNITGYLGTLDSVYGGALAGAILGPFTGASYNITISNITASGTVTRSDGDHGGLWGGLVGMITGAIVSNCSSSVDVSDVAVDTGEYGGFASFIFNSDIDKCYSTGDVSTVYNSAGGFACTVNWGAYAPVTTIDNCYSRSNITADEPSAAFIASIGSSGSTTINNVYGAGLVTSTYSPDYEFGLVYVNYETVNNSFWDIEATGTSTSDAGTGKTTAQMKTLSTFTGAGWNFTTIWGMDSAINDGYPYLLWAEEEGGGGGWPPGPEPRIDDPIPPPAPPAPPGSENGTPPYDVMPDPPTTPPNLYGEGDYSHLPAGPINDMLDAAGVPRAAWWFPFLFFGIGIIGFVVYGATTTIRGPSGKLYEGQIDGSLLMMFVVIEALLVVLGLMGPIPLWPAFIFPIGGLALILSKKHYSW